MGAVTDELYVDNAYVEKYTELYKPDYRLIEKCSYKNMVLKASLIPFKYEYTTEDLDYVTATQITLYLSQLTYLLVGLTMENDDNVYLNKEFRDKFLDKMHSGRLFFLETKQIMKKTIWKEKDICSEIKIKSVRKLNDTLIAFLDFNINEGSCKGTLKIGMRL